MDKLQIILEGINEENHILAEEVNFTYDAYTYYGTDKNIIKDLIDKSREERTKLQNVKLKESPIEKKSVFEYDLTSNGAADYNSLMIEIWKRLGGKVNE